MGGVVARQRVEIITKSGRLQILQQRQESLFVLPRQDEVVAFLEQRDEVKPMLVRSSLQTERRVRFTGGDQTGCFTMGFDDLVITNDLLRRDVKFTQLCIEPKARP